jgi:hypothetical protein
MIMKVYIGIASPTAASTHIITEAIKLVNASPKDVPLIWIAKYIRQQ